MGVPPLKHIDQVYCLVCVRLLLPTWCYADPSFVGLEYVLFSSGGMAIYNVVSIVVLLTYRFREAATRSSFCLLGLSLYVFYAIGEFVRFDPDTMLPFREWHPIWYLFYLYLLGGCILHIIYLWQNRPRRQQRHRNARGPGLPGTASLALPPA